MNYTQNTGEGTRAGRFLSSLAVFFLAAAFYSSPALSAVSCNPQGYASTIGIETVAIQCIPENMTDDTALYYIYREYECINGKVAVKSEGNPILITPNGILDPGIGIPFRNFRNKQGSYFFQVTSAYRGLIDGKSMNSYPVGSVYTDVFTKFFDDSLPVPSWVPDCRGGDFNGCRVEKGFGSTVNIGTGRLSHSQQLFNTQGGRPLSLDLTLYYRSMQFAPGAIGNGWSHDYEMSLQVLSYGATFWEKGKRRNYRLYRGLYYPLRGDYSTLTKNADGSYTITEKDGLKRNFDSTGAVTSLVDKNGDTLAFSYTGGRLSGVTDPNGRIASFSYDANGKPVSVTDPKGNVYSFEYTSGKLSAVQHPDGGRWSYTYGTNGLLASKTDPENHTVTYTYDTSDRVAEMLDPQGGRRSMTYPSQPGSPGKIPDPYPLVNWVPLKESTLTEKDEGGWTYTFNTLTETISKMVDPLGNTHTFTHDEQGNMLSNTEPGVGTTTYTYDEKGNVTSVRDPLNQTATYTYNSFAEVLTVGGAPGNTTNTYDSGGNITSTTNPAGETTQFEYDTKGNLTGITNAKGLKTVLGYDVGNNLTSVTRPGGAVTGLARDANGNVLTVTDPAGKYTTFQYDVMNRLTGITDPLANTTTYTYDKKGNQVFLTDANNNNTSYQYNYLGQLTGVSDPLNNATRFDYTDGGCPSCSGGVNRLAAVTDAKNQKSAYTYDKLGRLLTETDPLVKTTLLAYGPTDLPVSRTDANGATVSYAYDPLQRLTGRTYPDGASDGFTYDERGNILTVTGRDVSYTYVYDAANRVTSVTDSRGYSIAYEYDLDGNRTKITLMPGTIDERVTTFAYDNDDRLQTLGSPSGAFTFGYDPVGRRNSLSFPNGVAASYAYDDAGRLTGLSHSSAASFTYTHDPGGNRTGKTSAGTENYAYDLIYRLLNVTSGKPEAFSYDPAGNRQNGPGPKDTGYLYNDGNQMTGGRKLEFSYDDNGNQIARTVPGASDKSWTQGWDYENRLVHVEKIKGSERKTVTFRYDPFGRRIEKNTETLIDGVTATSTWTYIYDNEDIVLEVLTGEAGSEKTFYTHGPGIDEPLAMERGGSFYYYHADGLGSIAAITNAAKSVVQSYSYDSFGMVKPSTAFRNSFTYTAREWDRETGLYYYRARYYDPMVGRFISKDPIGFAGGDVNLYGYVQNNPVNQTDPTGLSSAIAIPVPRPKDIPRPTWCSALAARTILGASAILAGASAGSVPTCDEHLEPKGCRDDCWELNIAVQKAKERVGKLGACRAGMSKYDLALRYYSWLGLATARAKRDVKCWGGGDAGHQQAQADAWSHVGNCWRLLK
jgi:RHS repeat-associated protein